MATDRMGLFQAWIVPPQPAGNDYVFPWSLNFIAEPRLIPESYSRAPGGTGSASFRLLKKTRDDGHGDGIQALSDNVVAGAYICITAGISWGEAWDFSSVVWWGYISRVDRKHYKGLADETGSVDASGLGNLLDGVQLKGWKQESGTDLLLDLIAPPSWNVRDNNGKVLGNVTSNYTGNDGTMAFVRAVRDLSYTAGGVSATFGSRWGLLRHVCRFCAPAALPTLQPVDPTGGTISAYLDDTTIPEVIDIRDATIRGAIDVCVPRPRGLGWDLIPDPSGASWNISVYSQITSNSASGGFSAVVTQDDIDLTTSGIIDLRSTEDNAIRYDQVTIRGGRVVFCGSLACNDQADKGWSSAQEDAYLTAGGITQGDDTWALYQQKVHQWRNTTGVADVYSLLTVSGVVNSGVLKRYDGADGTASLPFFPGMVWNGSSLSADDSSANDPTWQTTRFMRSVPWEKGLMPDGTTDYRTNEAKALPTYLPPMAFSYEETPSFDWQTKFINLALPLRNAGSGEMRPGASIECDDRRPGLRVEFSPREWMAKGYLTDAVFTTDNIIANRQWALDWKSIVLTVAIESDQRVQVDAYRPGIVADGSQTRRRLIIDNPNLQCWVVHENTVLATNTGGNADLTTQQYIKRNDYPLAQKLCDMAASWAFRSRRSVTITLPRPDLEPFWASIGKMLGNIYDGTKRVTANTVVEAVSVTLGSSPRLTVVTTIPDQPDFLGHMPSPTAGGPISVGLGGTVSQAIQNLNTQVSNLSSLVQSKPNAKPQGTEQRPSSVRMVINQDAHEFVAGNIIVFDGSDWVLSTHPGNGLVIVDEIIDANAVIAVESGYIGTLTGLSPGSDYYVSTSGTLTSTVLGSPVLRAISETEGIFGVISGELFTGIAVTQTSHGFTAGKVVGLNDDGVWVIPSSYSISTSSTCIVPSRLPYAIIGMVSASGLLADSFNVITSGECAYPTGGLTPGHIYSYDFTGSLTEIGLFSQIKSPTVWYCSAISSGVVSIIPNGVVDGLVKAGATYALITLPDSAGVAQGSIISAHWNGASPIYLAKADTSANAGVFGVAIASYTASAGYHTWVVATDGYVELLVPGSTYGLWPAGSGEVWLSDATAGAVTYTKPASPSLHILIGYGSMTVVSSPVAGQNFSVRLAGIGRTEPVAYPLSAELGGTGIDTSTIAPNAVVVKDPTEATLIGYLNSGFLGFFTQDSGGSPTWTGLDDTNLSVDGDKLTVKLGGYPVDPLADGDATFLWYDSTNFQWSGFSFWPTAATVGMINCYDPDQPPTVARMTAVSAGTAYSVLGNPTATAAVPQAINAASDHSVFVREGTVKWIASSVDGQILGRDPSDHAIKMALPYVFGIAPFAGFRGVSLNTGSGSWTVPAGVIVVRIVVIGGGGSGGPSSTSTNGASWYTASLSGILPTVNNFYTFTDGYGGGGAMSFCDVSVVPGSSISYAAGSAGSASSATHPTWGTINAGAGGAGGAASSTAPGSGGSAGASHTGSLAAALSIPGGNGSQGNVSGTGPGPIRIQQTGGGHGFAGYGTGGAPGNSGTQGAVIFMY